MVCTKDKIYQEGYDAFYAGEGYDDNPYDEYLTQPQYELWEEGFLEGVREDAQLHMMEAPE